MRARDIVGKKVARVDQSWFKNENGDVVVNLDRLVFEDGTVLRFVTEELACEYATVGVVDKAASRKEGT